MALADWLRFVAIYGALCLMPGPSVLMVLGQVATHGLRAMWGAGPCWLVPG